MITPAEYAEGCRLLAVEWARWVPERSPWVWKEATGGFTPSLGGGYLTLQRAPRSTLTSLPQCQPLEHPQRLPAGQLEHVSLVLAGEDDAVELESPACCSSGGGGGSRQQPSVHFYSYYIAYSPSYGVPVMYFEAQDQGGSPLGLAQVLADLGLSTGGDRGAVGTMISHEEHPFTHRPCYMLHPCQTDEIMRIVTEAAAAGSIPESHTKEPHQPPTAHAGSPDPLLYMMAWLSVAGQVFGLQLPLGAWKAYWRKPK